MARKARQRISYVLPLPNSAGGHRLGVNGLAIDSDESVLYSAGRDGVICAWDLHLPLTNRPAPEFDAKPTTSQPTTLRQQVQAHTHWINDIALAQSNQALVSASSDITVKLWRPRSTEGSPPQSIGLHTDYVKRLAVPSPTSDWVASGGLDRKIIQWDLSGAGQKLEIEVGKDEAENSQSKEKGSVYALAATDSIIASGGPEGIVKLWDVRSGERVTKLVGHTDIVRDLLISRDGTTIWSASGDRTVKVWSTIGGRCMYTLTMHDASVWSLFSPDPDLSVVYSTDKNGLVAKTDARQNVELDEGFSVAVCQEHEGVNKLVAAGDSLWTATCRPSINRWRDVNIENLEVDVPESISMHRGSVTTVKARYPSPPSQREHSQSPPRPMTLGMRRKLPLKHVLRLSNNTLFPLPTIEPDLVNGATHSGEAAEVQGVFPVRSQPDFSIEGQTGLIKHVMLNDRKRILTSDTAGEVVMWDLLKCVPIRSFGKRHLEDVKDEVTVPMMTTVANWCSVNTKAGTVTVVLEENTCFDAEMYADELDLDPDLEFKEDQRINFGRWVLRHLFSKFIDEEIIRDDALREQILESKDVRKRLQRENAPGTIQLPQHQANGWHQGSSDPLSSTARPESNGTKASNAVTPGFNIGLATPFTAIPPMPQIPSVKGGNTFSPKSDDGTALEKTTSNQSQRNSDYFSNIRLPSMERTSPGGSSQPAVTPGEPATPSTETAPNVPTTPGKDSHWGKKFRKNMNMTLSGMKKSNRAQANETKHPAAVEEKDENETDSRSSKASNGRVVEDTLLGVLQKIRFHHEDSLHHQFQTRTAYENGLPVKYSELALQPIILPATTEDSPPLSIPPNTTILIQEEQPEAGGVADLFEGTVATAGECRERIEKLAPTWLGEVLLRNALPAKEVVKISFILEPLPGSGMPCLPPSPNAEGGASGGNNGGNGGTAAAAGNGGGPGNGNGNNGNGNGNNGNGGNGNCCRLNANRMLRAKKVLGYVAEKLEDSKGQTEEERGLRPEEYLELYCQGQLVPNTMTLATIRSRLWKGGNDVVLFYSGNGRKRNEVFAFGGSGYPPGKSGVGGQGR